MLTCMCYYQVNAKNEERGYEKGPNFKISMRFLAHLAKGNVSFCHHLASVVCLPLTFHILIFSSETP
jgi:hypothetical protein